MAVLGPHNNSRTFSLKTLIRRLSHGAQAANDVENEAANHGARMDDAVWWNASRQRIRDYISRIPTSSASEASPTIVVRRSEERKQVEIITNSAAYRKRLERSIPELQRLVKGHGYRICVTHSKDAFL